MITQILTDIEGTTSSISFVKDVLFPYARQAMPDFIKQNHQDSAVSACLDAVSVESNLDRSDLSALVRQLCQWIDEDVKNTALKTLQGKIWKQGYETGAYRAHVYPDAHDSLCAWKQQGLKIAVYSSGSIEAQKLFFRFSDFGDMSDLFNHHFDTTSGAKKEAGSYLKIRQVLGEPPASILFLSDIREELIAAREAGLKTCWLLREQDSTATPAEAESCKLHYARTFSDINPAMFSDKQ